MSAFYPLWSLWKSDAAAQVLQRALISVVLAAGLGCAHAMGQDLAWSQKFPATSPMGRTQHAMVYDAARGEVVLFGGSAEGLGFGFLADIWAWNGTNWIVKTPPISPPGRFAHAMAYDAERGELVLFGGESPLEFLSDTWVWDGTNWMEKTPATSPPRREEHAMAYDAARGEIVLFGGRSSGFGFLNDTWVWDGTNWIQKTPATSPPAIGEGFAMVYDAARGEVVLLRNEREGFEDLGDTWVWDGTNWTQKNPATKPPGRKYHAMTYEAGRGEVVLFGGQSTLGFLGDTWVWDGINWTEKTPATSPPDRALHAIAYDIAAQRNCRVRRNQ